MSTTGQCIRVKNKERNEQTQWSAVFPPAVDTVEQSIVYVKKLVAVSISTITYLRMIFPEVAYQSKDAEGLCLKILREDSGCYEASVLISWIKGCFDAIEKKYLREMTVAMSDESQSENGALETYTFRFSYTETGESQIDSFDCSTNHESKRKFEVRSPTIRLLRTMLLLNEVLKALPKDIKISMKLLYYDDVTPVSYEPPGFKPVESEFYEFSKKPVNYKIGEVNTGFHTIKLRARTDPCQSLLEDEQERTDENMDEFESEGMDLIKGDIDVPEPNIFRNYKTRSRYPDFAFPLPEHLKIFQESSKSSVLSGPADENVPGASLNMKTMALVLGNSKLLPSTPQNENTKLETPLITPVVTPKLEDALSKSDSMCSVRSVDVSLIPTGSLSEYPVRCPCNVDKDQGLMILCDVCGFWQHGACFTVVGSSDAPSKHFCDRCADPPSLCTDPRLCLADQRQVESTCRYRRCLVLLETFEGPVTTLKIADSLWVDISVGQKIIDKLIQDNILKPGKLRTEKFVDRKVLLNEAYPKYLNKNIPKFQEINPMLPVQHCHNDTTMKPPDYEADGSLPESPIIHDVDKPVKEKVAEMIDLDNNPSDQTVDLTCSQTTTIDDDITPAPTTKVVDSLKTSKMCKIKRKLVVEDDQRQSEEVLSLISDTQESDSILKSFRKVSNSYKALRVELTDRK